jgi:hypothetical protein
MTFLDSPPARPPASEVPARFSVIPWGRLPAVFQLDLPFRPRLEADREALAGANLITRAAEVRCSFPGCHAGFKGEVGWVVEVLIGDAQFGQEAFVMYVAPRGYKLDATGVFVETERAKKQRRSGHSKQVGSEPHYGKGDILAAPLGPNELPATTWAFGHEGWLVKCPFCRGNRFIRITEQAAAEHLPRDRCGVI